jgi:hypothetical protein
VQAKRDKTWLRNTLRERLSSSTAALSVRRYMTKLMWNALYKKLILASGIALLRGISSNVPHVYEKVDHNSWSEIYRLALFEDTLQKKDTKIFQMINIDFDINLLFYLPFNLYNQYKPNKAPICDNQIKTFSIAKCVGRRLFELTFQRTRRA